MKAPRVAQFVNTLDIGGATDYAMTLAEHADPFGTGVLLIAGPGDERAAEAERRGLEVERLRSFVPTHPTFAGETPSSRPGRIVSDLRAGRELTRLLRRHNVKLLHSHGSKARLVGALAARAGGASAIVQTAHGFSFHDDMASGPREARRTAERITGRLSHHLILESAFDRTRAIEYGLATEKASSHIYTGIDFEAAAPKRTAVEVRTSLGIPGDAVVFGTVGRLSEQKDPVCFARSAVQLLAARPNAHVVFVGDGALRPEVEAVVTAQSEHIHLLGMRDDVPDLINAFDVLVMTSRWEGIPLSILMAMLAAKPVIASAITGIPEVVLDDETGLGVEPGDVAGFSAAMQQLHDHPGQRVDFGEAGRKLVQSRHSLDAMISTHLDLYRTLLN